ncbi:MAG: hypothetical protein ABIT76_11160 [Chthoniobacterales bacterium]
MKLICPHCTQNLEVADEWAGHAVDCPSCQQVLTVPAVGEAIPLRCGSPEASDAHATPFRAGHFLAVEAAAAKRGWGIWGISADDLILADGEFGYRIRAYNTGGYSAYSNVAPGAPAPQTK